MASSGGIGNVIENTGLVEMAMAYSRSRILCAAAHLGVADALGDEIRSVEFLAEKCHADADALYRLLRALASIGVDVYKRQFCSWLVTQPSGPGSIVKVSL